MKDKFDQKLHLKFDVWNRKIKLQNNKKGLVENTVEKDTKVQTNGHKKVPRNWQKAQENQQLIQGKYTEISNRKTLKIHKMPLPEFCKMLQKYKFWIYYWTYQA